MSITTTLTPSIRCAHCKGRHVSVAAVRACATQPKITRKPVTEPGMYRANSCVYQVKLSQNDKLYACRLTTVMKGDQVHKLTFDYDKGAIFTLSADDRMSLAEVAELGRVTGHCFVCRKKLTVQKSIAAGIGPVCAKKV